MIKKFTPINRKKLYIKDFKKRFQKSTSFTTDEIYNFYENIEAGVKRNTVKWRIYELVNNGVIVRIGRGVYKFGESADYNPELTDQVKDIYRFVMNKFPFAEISVWDTRSINEFMTHQPASFLTIFETETHTTESLFNFLREKKQKVFLKPDKATIENYISGEKDSIIIKQLISEAPLMEVGGIKTATIEKILVDVYCDEYLFHSYHGAEMDNIYRNAMQRYTINQSKLLRYAARRGKRKEIEDKLKHFLTNGKN